MSEASFPFYMSQTIRFLELSIVSIHLKPIRKTTSHQKILKENNNISALVLRYGINKCINIGNSDVTPTYKREDRLLKENYRPISILPTFSKVYEKILHQQIYSYFDNLFSKFLWL